MRSGDRLHDLAEAVNTGNTAVMVQLCCSFQDFQNWKQEKLKIESNHESAVKAKIEEHETRVKLLFKEWENYAETTEQANAKQREDCERHFNRNVREIMVTTPPQQILWIIVQDMPVDKEHPCI